MNNIERQLRSLARRARLSVARGIVRLVTDATGLQLEQVSLMGNEVRSNLERFQNYGLTSVPLPGAEAAVVFVGGNRDHGLIIAVDDPRYRLKGLAGGEVAIYTDEGDKIHLKRGRNIEIHTLELKIFAENRVTVDTPLFRTTGDIIDNYESNSNNLQEMREIYNTHTHAEDDEGNTETPNQGM